MSKERVPALIVRVAGLAQLRADNVGEGNGLEGIWKTTVEDIDTDEVWTIVMNADDEEKKFKPEVKDENIDVPTITVTANSVVAFYSDQVLPAVYIHPQGGQFRAGGSMFERSTEDQIIASVEEILVENGRLDDSDRLVNIK